MMKHKRQSAATIALLAAIILLVVKFWAFKMTGSQAVFSDAMESIVNVLAAISLLLLLRIASKPADEDHPYGHGKAEFFSSAFEGGLITFASVLIIYESLSTFINGHTVKDLEAGLLVVLAAGLANMALGFYLLRRGKKLKSLALEASGRHVMSDFWTSVGVVVSLGLVKMTGWIWLDSVVAFALGTLLAYTGLKLLIQSTKVLMDAEDLPLLRHILSLFSEHRRPGIIRVHYTRVIRSGHYHHIDAHVVVPEFWSVETSHKETDVFEKSFLKDYEYDGEIHFHVDPCRRAYCRACDYPNCPVRQEAFKQKIEFTLEELRSPTEPAEFIKKK
jgi:cation diffusion facilitator family transporter